MSAARWLPPCLALGLLLACQVGSDGYRIYWERVEPMGRRLGGSLVPADAGARFGTLRVDGDAQAGDTRPVLLLEPRVLRSPHFALTGQVRHEDVEGVGFLELWSVFPDGGRYFSRTLAETGPLRALSGSSDWRAFSLPFRGEPGMAPPERLELNVVLPGGGRVELGPLLLVELEEAAWWGPRTAGALGGLLGALTGLYWAAFGLMAARFQTPRWIGTAPWLGLAAGCTLLAVGAAATLSGQPQPVTYPLLLGGGINAVLGAMLLLLQRRVSALVDA